MSSFNEFIKDNRSSENVKNTKIDDRNKKLEEKINEYQKLSSNDLMQEFIKLTIEKKQNGELTKKELENIKHTILPYLNEDQKHSLENLLDMVDNV